MLDDVLSSWLRIVGLKAPHAFTYGLAVPSMASGDERPYVMSLFGRSWSRSTSKQRSRAPARASGAGREHAHSLVDGLFLKAELHYQHERRKLQRSIEANKLHSCSKRSNMTAPPRAQRSVEEGVTWVKRVVTMCDTTCRVTSKPGGWVSALH